MVEFMEALGNTFLHLRARATRVRWGWYRKSKIESPIQSESPRVQAQLDTTTFPQLPPLHLPSSGVDEGYYHINVSDAGEDSVQPKDEVREYRYGRGPIEAMQPSLEDEDSPREHDNDVLEHDTSTMDDHLSLRGARATEFLSRSGTLIEQQKDVSAKRVQVRESRTALRYKREEELEFRAKFMKDLNSFFANQSHPDTRRILREFEILQKLTEEYLKMEDSHDQQEDQLEEEEYMLMLSMENFAGLSGKGPLPDLQTNTGPSNQLQEHDSLRNLPRCVINYLSRIGEERMLQERLTELESEWFITIERRDHRHHLHMALDEDSEEFLRTFDERRFKMWKDLNNAQLDVNALHTICLEQGHSNFDYEDLSSLTYQYVGEIMWKPDMGPLKLLPQEEYTFSAHLEVADQEEDFDHATCLVNLDWNTPKTKPMKSFNFFQELGRTGSMGSDEFISKWMLHQLRISSMSIWYLQRLLAWQPLREQGWEDHDISQNVLDGWFSDDVAPTSLSSDSYLSDNDRSVSSVADANGQ